MRIREYRQADSAVKAHLTQIWRDSVTATHTFLTADDIESIAIQIPELLSDMPCLALAEDENGSIAGFAGIRGNKLEMLFLHPLYRGAGIGKLLVKHAMQHHKVNYVCVNEQNTDAAGFYRHMGFHVFRRDESDEQGRHFPILHMKL